MNLLVEAAAGTGKTTALVGRIVAALAEQLGKLGERLNDLPPKVQAAVLMSHLYGYTYEEIGLKLSVVRNRVKKYLIKGLAYCRGEAAIEAA